MYKDEVVSHRYKRKGVVVIRHTKKGQLYVCKKSYIARKEHTTINAGRVMSVMSNREIKTQRKRRVGMITRRTEKDVLRSCRGGGSGRIDLGLCQLVSGTKKEARERHQQKV